MMRLFRKTKSEDRPPDSPRWPATTAAAAKPSGALLDSFICDPEIMAEVERLLSGRTRDIRLKGRIAAAFRQRSWRHTASVIRSWMIWVVFLDLFMLFLSLFLLPREKALATLVPSAVIIPAALAVAVVWQKPRSEQLLGWTLISGVLIILLSICWMGAATGGAVFERYLHVMLFVAITGVVLFNVPFIQTLAIAAPAMALYLAFHLGVANSDVGMALTGFFLFGSGVGATVVARRTMNILAHKSFLLELRDQKHLAELAETNRSLERLSKIDGLTGAANRLYLRERIEELWGRKGKVALLMCDIDDFKALNDHLGHMEGDRCLVEVARIIKACTRSGTDCVARYGGEEFLVLLPDAGEAEALAIGERIRREVAVAALPNPRSRVKPTVTLSIGVAAGDTQTPSFSCEVIQQQADMALYFAKRAGKDRVQLWSESMDTPEQDRQ
ncbi:GGDEF domain-containing protein [Chelativorans salis]|uniref:diguanylate cyclase n=1 Tax=Chelativorans salis TaxID=2978478 RepID=A0ABT2LYQ6_9HYPH|nr:diguanylate cyclase [Chelativorans sp. EGI FJ00035]MCT7378334.1 GGDEF domain-containing protein [Chelativorans sp. EGI FJ00035]